MNPKLSLVHIKAYAAPSLALWTCLAIAQISASRAADLEDVIHNFGNNFTDDGYEPSGSVIAYGSELYGATTEGGRHNLGAIYKVGVAGGGYARIHNFGATAADPGNPTFSLTLAGSRLFGVTDETIFTLKPDGTDYKVVFHFSIATGRPNGPLAYDGSALYGINVGGGTKKKGTVYRINSDGTGYSILHSFGSDANDGIVSGHDSPLTLSGNSLYGMTHQGGSTTTQSGPFQGYGTIFKLDTNGKNYKVLHSFYSFNNDGANPDGPVAIIGSTVFGTSHLGGHYNAGVVCSVSTNGDGYKILREFRKVATDGASPDSIVVVGSTLYGTTRNGGSSAAKGGVGDGTIFKIEPNGSGYMIVHSFGVTSGDGKSPTGPLALVGSRLYGTTFEGGRNTYNTGFSYTGTGTVFRLK